jgi:hypothetical protein
VRLSWESKSERRRLSSLRFSVVHGSMSNWLNIHAFRPEPPLLLAELGTRLLEVCDKADEWLDQQVGPQALSWQDMGCRSARRFLPRLVDLAGAFSDSIFVGGALIQISGLDFFPMECHGRAVVVGSYSIGGAPRFEWSCIFSLVGKSAGFDPDQDSTLGDKGWLSKL